MKKIIASGLIIVTLTSFYGCQSLPFSEKPADKPFSFALPSPNTEKSIAYYTQNDTFNTLTDSSPYYLGNQESDLPGMIEFNRLKKAKIAEAKVLTTNVFESGKKVETELAPLKAAYLDLMGTAREKNKKMQNFSLQAGGQITEYLTQESALKANYESIETSKITNTGVSSLLDYQKTYLALAYADTVLQDTNSFLTNSAVLVELLKDNQDTEVKSLLTSFDQQMEVITKLQPDLTNLMTQTNNLDIALKQINTGDYYLAKATIMYMEETFPDLKEKVKSLTPSTNLTAENIEAITEYTNAFDEFASQFNKQILNLDTKQLIAAEKLAELPGKEVINPWGLEIARATNSPSSFDALTQSYKALNGDAPSTASKIAGTMKEVASTSWSTVKAGLDKAKTAAGVTLDTASAIIKTPMDIYHGVNEGNSVSDVASTVAGNFVQIKNNYDADKSGSAILKEAGSYLKGAEKTAGAGAEALTEKLVGKGYSSWIAGHIASTTVGLFTGLGKGIYKVADKQATAGEMVEGMLDIGLSLIGGSKVVIKGSQAFSGAKETAKWSAEKAFNYLRQVGTKLEAGELKTVTADILKNSKLSAEQITTLIGNSLELEGKEVLAAELKTISKTLDEKFTSMVREGISTILQNVKTVPGQSYSRWVQHSFENSIKGLKDAMISRLGSDYTAYIDNIIAAKMNSWIKTAIKEYTDAVSYDGVYSKVYNLQDGVNIPVEIKIENGVISGGVKYTFSHEGWVANVEIQSEGTVNGKGEVENGKWTAQIKGGGPSSSFNLFGVGDTKKCTDDIEINGGGLIKGAVAANSTKISGDLTGNFSAKGTFWCEAIKDNSSKPIEQAIHVDLIKQELMM